MKGPTLQSSCTDPANSLATLMISLATLLTKNKFNLPSQYGALMMELHTNLTNSRKPDCVPKPCLTSLLGSISTGYHNVDGMIGIPLVHGIIHNDFRRSVIDFVMSG